MKTAEQKEIAIQCLEKLGIYKPYINKFKSSKSVPTFFENYAGFYADQAPELMSKIKEIEDTPHTNKKSLAFARLFLLCKKDLFTLRKYLNQCERRYFLLLLQADNRRSFRQKLYRTLHRRRTICRA